MKKSLVLISALCTLSGIIQPQGNCINNSTQLTAAYDHKNYHPVACTCPCDQYRAQGLASPDRNRCLQCLHYHDPQPFMFLGQKTGSTKTPLLNTWLKTPRQMIIALIARYRAQQEK